MAGCELSGDGRRMGAAIGAAGSANIGSTGLWDHWWPVGDARTKRGRWSHADWFRSPRERAAWCRTKSRRVRMRVVRIFEIRLRHAGIRYALEWEA